MNPIVVDQEHPDASIWFPLSEAQFDNLRLAAPVESALGFNDAHMEVTNGGLPEDVWGIYLTKNAGTSFATRYLSSSNTMGRQLRIPDLTPRNRYQVASAQSTAWRQIIGVVGDARDDGRLSGQNRIFGGLLPDRR